MSARNIDTLVINLTRRLTKHKRSSIVREAVNGLCSALNPLDSLQVAIHNTIEQLPQHHNRHAEVDLCHSIGAAKDSSMRAA